MSVPETFQTLVAEGIEHERRGAAGTDAALERYRKAVALLPGASFPGSRIEILHARRAWGPCRPPQPPLPDDMPRVSMGTLGNRGRFGNQLLQYGFLWLYAMQVGAAVETPDWIGRDVFDLDDPEVSVPLPPLDFDARADHSLDGTDLQSNVDLVGYFCFDTAAWAAYRDVWRPIYAPGERAAPTVDRIAQRLKASGRRVIGLHIRRGDFGYGRFWIAPLDWYRRQLDALLAETPNALVYVASDDPTVGAELIGDRTDCVVMTAADLADDGFPAGLEFLTDHFALRLADVVLIANSSFSFTAALLNDRAMAFFRPDPATRGFVAFDPWAAPVLLDAPWLADGTAVGADERALLPVLIRDGDTVFDVGANRGEWTRAARDIHWNARRVVYHAFEPNPPAFETLALLAQTAAPGQILARRLALGRAAGSATFHVYDWDDRLSGFNARAGEAMFTERPPPRKIEVPVDTIDAYCAREGVPHIHLLKLDVEGAEFDALQGAEHMLSHARVDAIQFEYGGTWRDAGTRLRDAHAFLRERGYRVFRLAGPGNLDPVPTWNPAREDFRYANFLAIHDRMLSHFGLAEAKMPELAAIARRHGIAMRGVAHIGAHLGEEVAKYDQWGIERVLLVEANPDLAAQLRVKFAQAVHVTVAACCLADTEDVRTFHVNAFSQSSSLLPLKLHEQLYPFAHVAETRQLRTTTLDHLLDEHALDPGAFNVLNIDVQGAELLVLKGAERQLPLIDLINVEVNFAELYAGVPGIEAIDAHLTTRGFERVVLACPYDRTWGDAIYVNTSRPPEPAAPESPLGRKVTALWKSELGAARRGSFLAVDASPDDIAFLADLGWRGLCVTRDPTATPALQVRIADSLRTDMALIDHPQALADALSAFGLDPCLDLLVLGKTAVADDLATHLWNAALRPALIVVAEPLPTSAMPKGFVGIASDTPAMGYRRQTDAG